MSGRRFVCHDDRYILNLASDTGAIVVSNDNNRELVNEKPEYKKVIEERILMYTFVNDRLVKRLSAKAVVSTRLLVRVPMAIERLW